MPPTVLMIVGWGRSGSTLLANVLGESPGVLAAGELRRVLAPGQRCGCGEDVAACPFWAPVTAAVAERTGVSFREVYELQDRVLRPRRTLRLLAGDDSADARAVAAFTRALYEEAAAAAGAELVVDSSKDPASAAQLARLTGLDAAFLHLVRDPRATSYSWSSRLREEQQSFSAPTAAFRWLEWNLLGGAVAARSGHGLRLRYEDFAAEPERALAQVAAFAGIELPAGVVQGRRVRLAANHHVGGNPNRAARGEVEIRVDEEWRSRIRPAQALAVTALTLPLLLAYGYPLRP